MKREDKSHHLYSLLAEMSEDETVSLLFIGLAREEAHHRLRIERAYKALYHPKDL
jgi:rubrerythrin